METEPSFEAIVRGVIEKKAKTQLGLTIESSDLKELFPELFDFLETSQTHVEAPVIEESSNAKPDVEILGDPSLDIQPTGIEGFSQLFKSRYEKIVRILMERPEARQLTKISKVNMEKGNVKIAGLVFSKKPTKTGGLEFTLDDDTGNMSLLALSPEAKKSAGDIALDQCVMVEADAVQGKLIVKNVIPARYTKQTCIYFKEDCVRCFFVGSAHWQ